MDLLKGRRDWRPKGFLKPMVFSPVVPQLQNFFIILLCSHLQFFNLSLSYFLSSTVCDPWANMRRSQIINVIQ